MKTGSWQLVFACDMPVENCDGQLIDENWQLPISVCLWRAGGDP